MSRWDLRADRIHRRSLFALVRGAGRAARIAEAPAAQDERNIFEPLEGRVLLAGDEPNFAQVFNTPSPLTPPQITINPTTGVGVGVTGQGSSIISPAGDDDVFRFTAPTNDFVRVWVDGLTTTSSLDSRVEIYTGTLGSPNPVLVASGSNNGTLSTGVFTDGWAGFKAVQGTEYFVVVRSDPLSGPGSTGDYTLRINALSTAFPGLNQTTGDGTIAGTIAIAGIDFVYRLQVPSNAEFRGIMTVLGTADAADLDARVEIFDTNGLFVVADSDAGNLTDSYLATVSRPNMVLYVRVRSDEFGPAASRPSTGAFNLTIDAIPDIISLDPVSRLSETIGGALANPKDADFYSFIAQGTGLSFISLGVGFPPVPDSALRIYNEDAVQIGFNELPGALSRLQIQLEGGKRYFVVVDAFDALGGGAYTLQIEAHHTFVPTNTQEVDDHVDTPAGGGAAARRLFELATPIVWGAPVDAPVPVEGLMPPLPNPGPDHVKVQLGRGMGRIHAGGDSDLFQFVPPIDMLGNFVGRVNPLTLPPPPTNAPLWLEQFRPATRAQIIAVGADPFLTAPGVRVFDSNFNVIFTGGEVITNSGAYGGLDPASVPPQLPIPAYGYTFGAGQPANIQVWGGEVYYVEITGTTGRYEFTIQVDAPTDTISNFGPTVVGTGSFANAWEVRLDANTGEGRNYNNAAGGQLFTPNQVIYTAFTGNGTPIMAGRGFAMNIPLPTPPAAGTGATVNNMVGSAGSRGQLLLRMSDLGTITTPTDTDLYQFRALYTGTAEVRLNTTNLADEFWEASVRTYEDTPPYAPRVNPPDPPVETVFDPKTKTYNSPLDGAIRIFDNDQTLIVYNDDNSVTGGESDDTNVGSFAGKTFWRRDPRAVFPVIAGNTYYIQVESGQRQNFTLTFPKVDWRRVTGSYELLVNTMPNLNFDDDHVNGGLGISIQQATPIPTNLAITSTTATLGSVIGEIDNTGANADDSDVFTFIAPGNGTVRFTLSTRGTPPDAFARVLTIFDGQGALLATLAGGGTNDIMLSAAAQQGDRFFVRVDGDEGGGVAEGRYTISVSGVPFLDDHASEYSYNSATDIPKDLYDYDGTETVTGVIETAGDTDLFTFSSLAFDMVTVSVEASLGFSPFIRVFEISIDPDGNPIRLQIANNGAALGSNSASVTFSVSAPPRTTGGSNYPTYYVLVQGVNPDQDRGTYSLTLTFPITTDDHPDGPNPPPPGPAITPGQFALATPLTPGPTGNGGSAGVIELFGDSDLFTFTLPAQGQVIVSIVSPVTSALLPRVRIIDEFFNAVADITTSLFFVTGPDEAQSVATFTFVGSRNARFYVMVEGVPSVGNVFKTEDTGAYTLTFGVPIPDDHANFGEFNLATNIPLSLFSGDGSSSGVISPNLDTDLFKFTAIINGTMKVIIATPGSLVTPALRLYNPNQLEFGTIVVDGGPGDEDGQPNGSVTRSIPIVAGSTYYLLVSSDAGGASLSGSYSVLLDGPTPPQGVDDHADAGDYANATQIILNQTTGDAIATGNIETGGDTDLFYFTSLAGSLSRPFTAFIQIVTPLGQTLDLGVKIIRQDEVTIVAVDTLGGPGYNAGVQFGIDAANERYYIEVDGLGVLTGSYIVRIDTSPEAYFLYYPNGIVNDTIREYISIGNANTFAVNYSVTIIYEDTLSTPFTFTGQVPPGKRGGITVSDGDASTASQILPNKRFAIVIESDGFLAASFSHYEPGMSAGSPFTYRASTLWSFAKGEKIQGGVNDAVDAYNPNPTPARVTLTWHKSDGTSGSIFQIVPGFNRTRFDFTTANLPVGQFAFNITSEPVNPSDVHIGVVAAQQHVDTGFSDGYAVLGDPDGGAAAGAIPGLVDSGNLAPSQKAEITFFNSSNTTANINLVGKYLNTQIPDLIRPITLNAFESVTLTGTQLGMVPNQTVGLRYDANTAITVLSTTRRFGDADANQGQSQVGTNWYFGDAFINRIHAGNLYFENMYFYNPRIVDTTIQLRFVFNVGAESSYSLNVAGRSFAAVPLHSLAAILNHAVFNYFSIEASAPTAFAVSMSHYDLVLAGGWTSDGAPLGLTNPIASV